MSNFAFLQAEWDFLFEAASKAEAMANSDARVSCFYARRSIELAVKWLYKHDKAFKLPYQDNLSALIHEPSFRQNVGGALFTKAKLIKDYGNLAVHSSKKVTTPEALTCTRELFHLCYWLAHAYGRKARPPSDIAFNLALVPNPQAIAQKTIDQLQKLEVELQARDEKLAEVLATKATIDEVLKKLRAS